MRHRLTPVLIAICLLAVGCGDDDAATDVGEDPLGDDPTTDLPVDAGRYPIADLSFTIQSDGPDGAATTYRLACLGDTATFTGDSASLDPAAACLALTDDAVRTRLIDGPPAGQICTERYGGPQLAGITGTLDDETVDVLVDRSNGCGINTYDVVLAALLPPAGTA